LVSVTQVEELVTDQRPSRHLGYAATSCACKYKETDAHVGMGEEDSSLLETGLRASAVGQVEGRELSQVINCLFVAGTFQSLIRIPSFNY